MSNLPPLSHYDKLGITPGQGVNQGDIYVYRNDSITSYYMVPTMSESIGYIGVYGDRVEAVNDTFIKVRRNTSGGNEYRDISRFSFQDMDHLTPVSLDGSAPRPVPSVIVKNDGEGHYVEYRTGKRRGINKPSTYLAAFSAIMILMMTITMFAVIPAILSAVIAFLSFREEKLVSTYYKTRTCTTLPDEFVNSLPKYIDNGLTRDDAIAKLEDIAIVATTSADDTVKNDAIRTIIDSFGELDERLTEAARLDSDGVDAIAASENEFVASFMNKYD